MHKLLVLLRYIEMFQEMGYLREYILELLDETRRPLACFDFDSWGDAIDFAQVCLANGHKVVLGKE